jgi:hypothetical protein
LSAETAATTTDLNVNGAFASVDGDDPDTSQGKARTRKRLISLGWNRTSCYGANLASLKHLDKKNNLIVDTHSAPTWNNDGVGAYNYLFVPALARVVVTTLALLTHRQRHGVL